MAWVTVDDVALALGYTPAEDDADWLAEATAAAIAVAQRRRAAAGYTDDPDTSPGGDVTLGCALYAADLYRLRGAVGDQLAAYDGTGNVPVPLSANIRILLGIGKPAVG